jgi:hypothetical protein
MKTQVYFIVPGDINSLQKPYLWGKMLSGCQYNTGGTNVTRTRHSVTVYVYDLSCLLQQMTPFIRGPYWVSRRNEPLGDLPLGDRQRSTDVGATMKSDVTNDKLCAVLDSYWMWWCSWHGDWQTGCVSISLLTLANFICTAAVEDWHRYDWLVRPDISEYHNTFSNKCQENGSSCLNIKKIRIFGTLGEHQPQDTPSNFRKPESFLTCTEERSREMR